MLIINADDLGRCAEATDAILACYLAGRITSASAMVFMDDSNRAAARARESGLPTGLHLNLTERFTGQVTESVRRSHERIGKFLRRSKYALLIYHPFLARDFRDVVNAQIDEYQSLYGRAPTHVDGHQHMHLCTNVLRDQLLPHGVTVRRSFSFRAGEKSFINRFYRLCIDRKLAARHALADAFFSLSQHMSLSQLKPLFDLSRRKHVELMNHPQLPREREFLMSGGFATAIAKLPLGTYRQIAFAPARSHS